MARGSNLILLSFSIVTVLVIMSYGGGLLSYSVIDYNDNQQKKQAKKIIDDMENSANSISITNPISSLASAYSLVTSLFRMAFNLDSMLILIGIPSWIASAMRYMYIPILIMLVINFLNRNDI
jgi:hypothetical protein